MVSTKHLEVEQQISLTGHSWQVSCLDFSPNGLYLASGGWDKTIRIWDLSLLETSTVLANGDNGHTAPVTSVSWLPDIEFLLVSSSADGTAAIWNMDNGAKLATFPHHTGWVLDTSLVPFGGTLCTASWDKTLHITDIASLRVVNKLQGHSEAVWSCDFATNSANVLCSSSDDCSVKVWDTRMDNKWTTAKTLIGAHEDGIRCCAWSPCGRYIAAGSSDSKISIWDIRQNKLVNFVIGHEDTVTDVVLFEKSGGGTLLASAGDWSCRLWYPLSRRNVELNCMRHHDEGMEVECLSISPDRSLIATGGRDNKIMLSTLVIDSYEQDISAKSEAAVDGHHAGRQSTISMVGSSASIVDHAVLRSGLLEKQRSAMTAKQTIKIKVKPTSELLQSKLMQLKPNNLTAEEPLSPTTAADKVKNQIFQLRKVDLAIVNSQPSDVDATSHNNTSDVLEKKKKTLRSVSSSEASPLPMRDASVKDTDGSMRYKSKELLGERTRLRHVDMRTPRQNGSNLSANQGGVFYQGSDNEDRSSSVSSEGAVSNPSVSHDALDREMDHVTQTLMFMSHEDLRATDEPMRAAPYVNESSYDAML